MTKREKTLWAAVLAAACLVTYANGLGGAFTYDDKAIVRDNSRIRSPGKIGEIFQTSYFGSPRGSGTGYRPVLLLSFAVEWWIHGKDAVAFHAVNLAFHIAATLLFAGLLVRLAIPPPAVLASSLLFAVHPIHVEAVTSLVGRGETQAAILTFLYLYLALRLLRLPPPASRLPSLIGALLCYALALLTKESAASDPALAFLLLAFAAEGTLLDRLWTALCRGLPLYIGSAVVLAGVFALRARVLGGYLMAASAGIFEVENPLAPLSSIQRAANGAVLLVRYIGRTILPLRLSADESAWSFPVLPAASPLPIAALLLLVAAIGVSLALFSRRSLAAVGFLFFFAAMLPTGNLLFPIGTVFAERLAYTPSAGLCLAAGAWIAGSGAAIAGRRRILLAVLALLFSARAIARNAVWQSDEDLFFSLITTAPDSAKAHYDYAYASADLRHYRRALLHYDRAIEIYEDYWDAWAGKGRMEKELGLLEDAEDSYETAIEVRSDYENGYFGLGLVREARGDWEGAEEAYRTGLAKKPESLPLAYRLALARSRRDGMAALADWRRAVAINPDNCSARGDFAAWLARVGRDQEAGRQAREALRRDPACVAALRALAQRDGKRGWRLGEALARERAFRLSRSAEDWKELQRLAAEDETYARRFARIWKKR